MDILKTKTTTLKALVMDLSAMTAANLTSLAKLAELKVNTVCIKVDLTINKAIT